MVAVYSVLGAKFVVGENEAVVPLYDAVPSIFVVPCCTVNFELVIVAGSISTLNVAVTSLLVATLMALFNGLVEITRGRTFCSSSFVQPDQTTTKSIAAIENIFVIFILVCFKSRIFFC